MTNKTVVMCACDGRGGESLKKPTLEKIQKAGVAVVSGLCRSGLESLAQTASKRELIIGCSQEASVMDSLLGESVFPVNFVNLRGVHRAQPKSIELAAAIGAKAVMESSYDTDGVPSVVFHSKGRLAVIADEHIHPSVIESAAGPLEVDVLVSDAASLVLSPNRKINALAANVESVSGYLGAFEVSVTNANPIDSELCTRCGECVDACPSGAISSQNFTINLTACDGHRACVKACGNFKAIDFDALNRVMIREYDLVIDLRRESAFADRQPPLGYWYVGASVELLASALIEAVQTVGEFEKPKFFSYKPSVCAHSRSNLEGCSACIETCSTKAIHGRGQGIEVNPHLCLGCGACASVCPTGAIQYALTPAQALLRAAKEGLKTYAKLGGQRAHAVIHAASLPHNWLELSQTNSSVVSQGLIPIEAHHAASVGPDAWLSLLAFGANRVTVALSAEEHEFYAGALAKQAQWVNDLTTALGLGKRVSIQRADSIDLSVEDGVSVAWSTGAFDVANDKRTRLTFAIEHLAEKASPTSPIPLSKPAPFGTVLLDANKCTLCMSCTGACPSSALIDNPLEPQLRFIERNCVQCGLCVETCPEDAISLVTQLDLSPKSKEKRVLNQSQPFHCTSCGKAFGTKHMIENMIQKLSGHSMFESNAKRLTMCGDCRVVNMFEDKNEMTIFEVKR